MTTTCKRRSRRRLDLASFTLTVIGLASGVFSYCLITYADITALIMIPSVVAATIGATHLIKHEVPRYTE